MAYQPDSYWSERLTAESGLRGTGHLSYSDTYNTWLYRQKARALAAALPTIGEGSALDIGSGTGWVVNQLLGRGYLVEGCDITAVAVEYLAGTFPGSFFQLDVGRDPIPRPNEQYDLVTMLDVSYHITDDDKWQSAVAEAARVLRTGGKLVVTDTLGSESAIEAEHVRKRSRADWERAAVGLRLFRVAPLFRFLSRQRDLSKWRHLPDGLRGRVEYALERLPVEPHMRIATFVKQ